MTESVQDKPGALHTAVEAEGRGIPCVDVPEADLPRSMMAKDAADFNLMRMTCGERMLPRWLRGSGSDTHP